MSLVKWDPWREMESLFDRYTRAMGWPRGHTHELVAGGDWSPRVDITETDSSYEIVAEIPGVRKKDVKVTVDNGVLTVSGERKQEKEEKDKKLHRVERYYGSFCRSFALPDNVNSSNVKATFDGGVLNLTLPKTEQSQPKAIEVKVE
jgi:HSP20 family protein